MKRAYRWPYVSAIIKQTNQQNKQLSFSLVQGDTYFLEELLRAQQIDLAFVHLPLTLLSEDVVITPLQHAQFRVLCHKDSPLTEKSTITLADLAAQPLALMRKKSGYGVYDKVIECFIKAGINPFVQFDATDVPMLVNLVQAQLAVALMPMLGESQWSDVVSLPVPELDCVADDLVLVYLAQRQTDALRQIVDTIIAGV